MTALDKEPREIIAGDTIQWTRLDLETTYPSGTWTLKYAFRGISVIAPALTGYSVLIKAEDSAKIKPGEYWWDAYITKGSGSTLERYRVGHGRMTVKPDLEGIQGQYDGRSHARKVLDAIEAVLENRATSDQLSYTIGAGNSTRQLAMIPHSELLEFREKYRQEVRDEIRAEEIAEAGFNARQTKVRFRRV